jgi:hypothetical protein
MFRIYVCAVAAVFIASPLSAAIAQSAAPAAVATTSSDGAKPSRLKLTMDKLKEMRAKWTANKPKLRACRQEVKAKGLTGDDRWFYIEDCMTKS